MTGELASRRLHGEGGEEGREREQRSGKGGMLQLTVRRMRGINPTYHQQGYQKLNDIVFPGI